MNLFHLRFIGGIVALPLLQIGFCFAVETTIMGGRMELKDKGERVVFSDGVRLERQRDTVEADRMETNQRRDKVRAWGAVKMNRIMSSTESVNGTGAEGFYDTKKGEGFLLGKSNQARIIHTQVLSSTTTRKIDIVANRFDFLRSSSAIVGTGEVYGKSVDPETLDEFEFWSDTATYDGINKLITLTGQRPPKVIQKNGLDVKEITGDKLIFLIETKNFSAIGNARAVFSDRVDVKEK